MTGRYFSLDRDNRWERVAQGYGAMVNGVGAKFDTPLAAIEPRMMRM